MSGKAAKRRDLQAGSTYSRSAKLTVTLSLTTESYSAVAIPAMDSDIADHVLFMPKNIINFLFIKGYTPKIFDFFESAR